MSRTRTLKPLTAFAIAAVALALSGCFVLPPTTPPAPTVPVDTIEPMVPSTEDPNGAAADDSPSVCGLPGVEWTSTLTNQPDVEWDTVHALVVVPSGASGPGVTDADGFRSCYAHTAEGALLAAANMFGQLRDPALAARLYEYSGITAPAPARDPMLLSIEGFQLVGYNGSSSYINLAIAVHDGGTPRYQNYPIGLIWQNGDWLLDLSAPFLSEEIPGLDDFVPFAQQ